MAVGPAVRWRTDGAGRAPEDGAMKAIRAVFPTTLYARWVNATWPILADKPNPAKIRKAEHQWESEGGSLKPVPKPPL